VAPVRAVVHYGILRSFRRLCFVALTVMMAMRTLTGAPRGAVRSCTRRSARARRVLELLEHAAAGDVGARGPRRALLIYA
jgi:hypothetical protein